jgi:meso-butanediol dehydrogenase/(S,S)-butanediol dehydrogenase/diacetyl reductase
MKIALITGAARGIGLASTKLFLDLGWHVVMVDIDGEELSSASQDLSNVTAIAYDVSVPANVEALQRRVAADFGQLDALVNNAGLAIFGPIEETSFDQWRRVMANNLDAPFLMVQAFTELLAKAKGSIVNITSISGFRASTLRVAYGTSKAALAHLTQQQAVELGEYGIRANAIAPGPVNTKLALAVHSPEIRAAYHDVLPLNRYGTEQEIANVIVFLCKEEASFITGQIIGVDGGFQASGIGIPELRK